MAKKFMYVCLGILMLTVAFHLGAQHGSASIVDHSVTGVIATEKSLSDSYAVLLDNGEVWYYTLSSQDWEQWSSPPMPVSDIKFFDGGWLVSSDNQIWVRSGGIYQNCGSPPAGPTLTQPTTWSRIKAEFGE